MPRIHTTLEISLFLQMKATKNCYHVQMRSWALMPQKMVLLAGLRAEPRWGAYSAPQTS